MGIVSEKLRIRPLDESEMGRGVILEEIRIMEIRAETMRLVFEGHSQKEICQALGASRSRLSRWCRAEIMETNSPLRLLKHKDRTLTQAMWDRVEVNGPSDCWPWVGTIKENGYGTINFKGTGHHAHRLMYETLVAAIPDDREIDHICRNRACVNPRHLQTVTHTENLMLAWRRRRAA